MYCSSCGALLPAGRTVCERCHPGQAAPAFAAAPVYAAAPAVHPACHAIAVLVGINLAQGLLSFFHVASGLLANPQYARNTQASFLMIPVSQYTSLMLSAILMLVTGACVVGLYMRNRIAWGALLGLKAIFLPFSLYYLILIIMMLMGSFSRSMNLSNNSLYWTLESLFTRCFGLLLNAGVIFLLLKFKNNLVR